MCCVKPPPQQATPFLRIYEENKCICVKIVNFEANKTRNPLKIAKYFEMKWTEKKNSDTNMAN